MTLVCLSIRTINGGCIQFRIVTTSSSSAAAAAVAGDGARHTVDTDTIDSAATLSHIAAAVLYTRILELEVCPLNKSDLRSLDFSVTRLLMKLFRTSNRDIINECCSHFCFKLPSEILPARFDRFLCKLQQQLRL